MPDLTNQVAIVTGAVGNVGAATAGALQRAGAHTVLVDRSADRLGAAYPDLAGSSDHLFASGIDLTKAEDADRLVALTLERFGRIDALVNAVGAFRGGKPLQQEALETWGYLFTVNVRTTLNTCRAVTPRMIGQRAGKIVNVAAGVAISAPAGLAAYAASKASVVKLTESLAAELAEHGCRANAVAPGTLDTPQNREAMPDAAHDQWATPDDVARVIAFLVSDAAQAINGTVIPICGRG